MSLRLSRVLAIVTPLVLGSVAAGGLALGGGGCGSDAGDTTSDPTSDAPSGKETGNHDDSSTSTGTDAGIDSRVPDAEVEAAACTKGKVKPATGETCVGFGKGNPCDVACGEYGYVCFNGAPPGFAGCREINDNGQFGSTYCCPQNKCVPQPDQDGTCLTAGKTHRYQCPPDGTGGTVAPPAGCADAGAGGSLERFYCCP